MRLDVGVALKPDTDGDSWGTPDDLFHAYEWEFGFTLDAACQSHNAKLPGFKIADGLETDWGGASSLAQPAIFGHRALGQEGVQAGSRRSRSTPSSQDGNRLVEALRHVS